MMRDKYSGKQLRYCFVEFDSKDDADYVLQNYNGKSIPNTSKHYKLNIASFNGQKEEKQYIKKKKEKLEEYQIFVGDLDINVDDNILFKFFDSKYESISSVKVMIDPKTKVSKSYGFVNFYDHFESQKAITEMNGQYLLSRPIRTKYYSIKRVLLNLKRHKNYPSQCKAFRLIITI
jgi:RNA recognition motif-containing protein